MTSKQWLLITILTFATICAWVIFGIIHERAGEVISPDVQQIIEPLKPDFNTSVFKSQP